MLILTIAHVVFGLIGIAFGVISVVGLFLGRRLNFCNSAFLIMTFAACVTGFIYLPIDGITSAQWVGFFLTILLGVAGYARYRQRLQGEWLRLYAFTIVAALFLNVLIATAQSFLHVPMLKALAPSQESPIYVTVKFSLLLVFILTALVTAYWVGRKSHALK